MSLIAQQYSNGALEVATPTGVAVVVIAVSAAVAMAWLWRSTQPSRISAGAPTMNLRGETPALVDLLTGGFEVQDDAMPATVIDLAARGYFDIDEIGDDRILLRMRTQRSGEQLTRYEQRVLTHVERNQTDGVVPAPVLTLGPQGVSERWFRGFSREVCAHGKDLGLCHRRWDVKHLAMAWGLVAVAAIPATITTSAAPRTSDPAGWGSLGNLLLGLAFLVTAAMIWFATRISRSSAQVDTPAGAEAASHWLGVRNFYRDNGRFGDKPAASVAIWERNLAYATALGLAPLVQRQIPFETEHDRYAWSRAGGHWRRVKVSYRAPRPGWGETPLHVAFTSLVRAVLYGAVAVGALYLAGAEVELEQLTDDQRRMIGFGALLVAVIAAAAAIWAVVKLVLGVSDLFAKNTVEGELIRLRVYKTGHQLPKVVQWLYWSQRNQQGRRRNQHRRTRWYAAIDPGNVERIRAYRISPKIHRQVQQGATVRATVSPRLGYVSKIETLAPPPASAATDAGAANPLVAEGVNQVLGAMTGKLAAVGGLNGVLDNLEQATDHNGRPVLDQVDEDGMSLRQRLDESREQIDKALAEPDALDRNPLLGQILGTLMGDGPSDDKSDPDQPGRGRSS
jgi:hypothetical protein